MDDTRRKISEKMSNADNEVADLREKVKSFDKEIKVSTKGINETKSEKEDAEKKRTEALKVVSQIELDLRDIKDRISSEKRAKVLPCLRFLMILSNFVLLPHLKDSVVRMKP